MRIVVSIVLGLIAVAAAVVWAIGQFGGGPGITIEAREPMVREPEMAALSAPASPAAADPGNARKLPGTADAPAAPTEEPAEPATPPPVSPFSTLNTPAPGEPATAPATPAEGPVPLAPAGEQRVTPQNSPAPAAAASSDAVSASLEAQFKSRRLTYNRPPAKLALDRAIDVALLIDTSRQTDAVDRLQGLPGEIVARDVDLSDTVAAELLGAAFDIQLQTTSTRQKLSSKLANEWRWRVTPKQKGTHTLTLNVYGYAVGSLDAEPLDSFRDEITVEVEAVDEIVTWARGVQPLFAVLAALAGIGSATFAFLRFREEKKQTKVLTTTPKKDD
jgi:hypothetical protein